MIEQWKDIIGYEGHYQVSNFGRVKSLKGGIEKILKDPVGSRGYRKVSLIKNGKTKTPVVHRLVMISFIGKSDLICNHINADKTDNRLENLEYCTHRENTIHGLMLGNIRQGERTSWSKLKSHQVKRIKDILRNCNVERGYWQKLARATGIPYTAIANIKYNNTWKSII